MDYYNILLTDAFKKVCTITTPFGKYKYISLPMGVCIAPDIFKEQISALTDNLDFVSAYLDDLLIITPGSPEKHLDKAEDIMKQLQLNVLKFNIDNWKFAVLKVE